MVHYSKSFYDFLQKSDNKIAKALTNAYYLRYKAYNLMITTSEVNYLTFRNDGTISFLPSGKEHLVNDDGTWKKENRQNGKPSKVIRKLFTDKALRLFKQSDFESFGNEYKAKFSTSGMEFKLLDNKQIPDVYEMDRGEGGGSLNGSCMNGDSEYLDIYKYCESLQILILVNKDGLLCGRSLVWKINDEITLMDRIYVTEDHLYDSFLSYCKEKNWWRKEYYKSYDNKDQFVDPLGNRVTKYFTINTDTDHDSYPYIDTFTYGEDGSLNNRGGQYSYNNTDGKRDGEEDDHDDEIYDEIDNCYISEDDAVRIERGEYRDQWTHTDNTVEVNGRTYWNQDENITIVNGKYYHIDDTCYSDFDDETYLLEDCVYSEKHETYLLYDDAIEVNGNYYHKDDDCIIEINNSWYHKEDDLNDTICVIDGEYYEIEECVNINDTYYLLSDDRIIEIDGEYQLKQLSLDFAA
jgi:hypothetical protein